MTAPRHIAGDQPRVLASDTSRAIGQMQVAIWRRMTPLENGVGWAVKCRIVSGATFSGSSSSGRADSTRRIFGAAPRRWA